MLSEQEDRNLRGYALRLHPELGEDAYHNAVCHILIYKTVPNNVEVFFRVAIKRALWKIYRHEKSDREQSFAFLQGDPPSTMVGLLKGREKMNVRQVQCRRGHEFTEDNIAYIGERRTCKMCKRTREVKDARDRYWRTKVTI